MFFGKNLDEPAWGLFELKIENGKLKIENWLSAVGYQLSAVSLKLTFGHEL